jgi:DNA-binding response OmpR family regulator
MPRVLLIDDDRQLLDVLSLAFEEAGYEVATADGGRAGLASASSWRPNAIVCDVNMPDIDGFHLCRSLREKRDFVPLILLTSRDNEIDETIGLDLGADDYVAKPFSTRALLARVAALLRREALRAAGGASPVAVRGLLAIDADRLEVRWRHHPIATTLTEFRVIEALVRRPGVVLSRATLLEQIRDDGTTVGDRIVDTYVRRLRRKLEALDPSFDRIETVVGAGYRWRDDGA